MSRYDFAAPRLYVNPPLAQAAQIALDQAQVNYVRNVLRLSEGARILVFNGRDGEWETSVATSNRKYVTLAVDKLARPQEPRPDLHYLFAPLKQARQDYMVEKAVEMGAGLLRPVLTSRTQASRINSDRMQAHAIAAAEQCGILSIPEIAPPIRLDALLSAWEQDRHLIFCDEDAPSSDPLAALRPRADAKGPPALAVLIGPEGGFDAREREALLGLSCVVRLPLGPRILRADTAAVAALALVQATLGDWRG
jgi:16S rRNA (uracil1498-N3)-methyltransferase